MTVPIRKSSAVDSHETILGNEFGETALPFAPRVVMDDGDCAVPQQYLEVVRTLDSVEAILNRIQTPEHHVLFAGEENGLVYLMVGVIGYENYVKRPADRTKPKIVYGRRWLLEPTTPTSEVVQTALLAIKKAREHELREHFILLIRNSTVRTTPFNCHMDLPLMAGNSSQLLRQDVPSALAFDLKSLLRNVRVGELRLQLESQLDLSQDSVLFAIRLESSNCGEESFSELNARTIRFVSDGKGESAFLQSLFTALLAASDRYVEEQFSFDGFRRFSNSLSPVQVAEFSYRSRNIVASDERFDAHFKDMSYRVDASKAPQINSGELGEKQRAVLTRAGQLEGYLPHGL